MQQEPDPGQELPMESYTNFAYVYDRFMEQENYVLWANRICRLLEKYGLKTDGTEPSQGMEPAASFEMETGAPEIYGTEFSDREALEEERNIVVDLGCGTGKITEILASRGYDMIGIDLSEDMLAIAQQRKLKYNSSTLYTLQDMRDFELYGAAGAMISVGDSINYLLEEKDLAAMFHCVERALLPGGIFIFDFKTIHLYRDVIGDRTIAEDRGECAFIWDNWYDPETCVNEYDLSIFVSADELEGTMEDIPYPYTSPWEEDGARFHRFHEMHRQRGYETGALRRAAESAGLSWIMTMDMETGEEMTDLTERAVAVVRKQKEIG